LQSRLMREQTGPGRAHGNGYRGGVRKGEVGRNKDRLFLVANKVLGGNTIYGTSQSSFQASESQIFLLSGHELSSQQFMRTHIMMALREHRGDSVSDLEHCHVSSHRLDDPTTICVHVSKADQNVGRASAHRKLGPHSGVRSGEQGSHWSRSVDP
jgi:hypothetical protein